MTLSVEVKKSLPCLSKKKKRLVSKIQKKAGATRCVEHTEKPNLAGVQTA